MFAFAPDFQHAVSVFMFSGIASDNDHEECGRALTVFNSRVAEVQLPAILLVDESRSEGSGWSFSGQLRDITPLQAPTLLAVVTPGDRGVQRAIRWAITNRYIVYPAQTVEEAVTWVERHRACALHHVFEALLVEARLFAGPDTARHRRDLPVGSP